MHKLWDICAKGSLIETRFFDKHMCFDATPDYLLKARTGQKPSHKGNLKSASENGIRYRLSTVLKYQKGFWECLCRLPDTAFCSYREEEILLFILLHCVKKVKNY